ncbi:hypothetical protein CI109_103146 [Kwoniella shandongensis]|uniref:Uncharacterized protein n=1 Tax=Kwoniella shandongensis TaxID=1734106 RepID=A0A5M6CDG6_9TREE|nr:uncharacterized protein CI109_000337 [Kwoniella shandongensis]KAA5531495.1 hypothetical protein CI109_000337 [Kwoniella shandongensis]
MSALPEIPLNDGRKIPVVGYGFGTANLGKDSSDAVVLALSQGFYHLDGAEYYANDESIRVGLETAKVPREEMFYTTKCCSNDPRKALQAALKTLNLGYVDLYLLHGPDFFPELGVARAWEICEEMQREGLCRSIGVSNFRVKDLEDLLKRAKVKPAINQFELHPYLYKHESALIDYCKTNDIAIATYASLTPLTSAKGGPVDATVERIAAETGFTSGQVLLKWSQQVTSGIVITTSGKASRLQEQLVAFTSMPDLTKLQINAIVENGRSKHHRIFFPHMDEL